MKYSIAIFVKNLTSGGAEKQAVVLARVLAPLYDIHFIVLNDKFTHQKYVNLLKQDLSIKYVAFSGNLLARYKSFVSYLKENHVMLVFSYLTAANFFACLAKIFCRIKVCTGLRNAQLPIAKRVIDCLLTYVGTDCAIANCYAGAVNFKKQHFNANKIIVIPNCFEKISEYRPKKDSCIPKIIIVGRFVPQKDYETAIQSISLLKKKNRKFEFLLVGYGELESTIREWLHKYNVEDITSVCINPNNIDELLEMADVYLSTSLFEGTSNSIMEAMNANLPIIATDVGDNNHLVSNEENGFLVPVGEASIIAEKMCFLLDNCDARNNMGRVSKEKLLKNFSTGIFLARYEQVIKNFLR